MAACVSVSGQLRHQWSTGLKRMIVYKRVFSFLQLAVVTKFRETVELRLNIHCTSKSIHQTALSSLPRSTTHRNGTESCIIERITKVIIRIEGI